MRMTPNEVIAGLLFPVGLVGFVVATILFGAWGFFGMALLTWYGVEGRHI